MRLFQSNNKFQGKIEMYIAITNFRNSKSLSVLRIVFRGSFTFYITVISRPHAM